MGVKAATLMDLHFFISLACRTWAIFLRGEGARAMEEEFVLRPHFAVSVFAMMYRFLCSRTIIAVFLVTTIAKRLW